jgi:CRP/FNR family transcriptional regulator
MKSTLEAYVQELFPQFEPALKQALIQHGQLKTFKEGEQLMRSGQYFKSTLIVLEGLIKILREDGEGHEFLMYYLTPGHACALSMVCSLRLEASEIMAKTVKDSTVIMVPLDLMDTWMTQYRTWYEFVLGSYRNRFEELLETIDQIAFKGMDERLEFYLKKHRQSLQSNTIPLSHQQIADELNSSREVVSRLLKKMEQLGKVKLHRNAVQMLNT